MFTGIIESKGIIKKIMTSGTSIIYWVSSPISKTLKPNQSLAHNGVCLTIEEVKQGQHRVTLVKESLEKTNFKNRLLGSELNLERCLKVGDRLDGHFLQGHVDETASVIKIINEKGSHLFQFKLHSKKNISLIVEKGSIAINGISLTCFDVKEETFKVAIIPHTFQLTTMNALKKNDVVNIEFDILGKYILKSKPI